MSINRIETSDSFSQEQLINLQNMSHKKLDTSDIINLQDVAAVYHSTVKDLGIKVNGIDLSTLPTNREDEIKLNLKDVYGSSINTTNFEFVVNHMGLDKEQTAKLNDAIQAASDILNRGDTQGTTYGMRISQANLEFKYISDKLVPKEYQDQFNSYLDDYTKQISDHYVGLEKVFAKSLMDRTDQLSVQLGWNKMGKEMMQEAENGTDTFQRSENEFHQVYSNIDVTKDNVKDQLDCVYKNLLNNGVSAWSTQEPSELAKEIKYLSDKWNSLMDVMGDKNNKFTTSLNYTV